MFGWETLAYMLFGMAALKSGFLRGAGATRALSQGAALIGFGIGIPALCAARLDPLPATASRVPMTFACHGRDRPVPAADDPRHRRAHHPADPPRRRAGRADRRRRARRLHQLSRHQHPHDDLFYGYGFGLFGTLAAPSCGWW
jgi:hypothetical protein